MRRGVFCCSSSSSSREQERGFSPSKGLFLKWSTMLVYSVDRGSFTYRQKPKLSKFRTLPAAVSLGCTDQRHLGLLGDGSLGTSSWVGDGRSSK